MFVIFETITTYGFKLTTLNSLKNTKKSFAEMS